ncbi:hypothetical protein XarbCFBP6827_08930 [Xanthomonas arboricola]|nr:hypothetical protein XarbCFBP6827_08930 [Xanthomonas arboricola]
MRFLRNATQQLRRNIVRADRLDATHDEFSNDRAENRLIHGALRKVLGVASVAEHQRLARELAFTFADVPSAATLYRISSACSWTATCEPIAKCRIGPGWPSRGCHPSSRLAATKHRHYCSRRKSCSRHMSPSTSKSSFPRTLFWALR